MTPGPAPYRAVVPDAAPCAHEHFAGEGTLTGRGDVDVMTVRFWCTTCLLPFRWFDADFNTQDRTEARLYCRPMGAGEGEQGR